MSDLVFPTKPFMPAKQIDLRFFRTPVERGPESQVRVARHLQSGYVPGLQYCALFPGVDVMGSA